MASGSEMPMAKRQKLEEEEEVSGYIHAVSPIKTSARNTKYFDAKLQVESDVYQKMVCFDPSKHSDFVEAQRGKSPLNITGIKEVLNRENNQKTDVLVNARSRIKVAKNLQFMFHPYETYDEQQIKNISEIQDNIPEKNTVSLLAKVVKVGELNAQEVRGQLLSKREIMIADNKGMITLTLWDKFATDAAITVNSVFFIKNVATRLFSNIKSLTTTKSSLFTEAEDQTTFQDINNNTFQTSSETATVEGEILNILIKRNAHCLSCNRKMPNIESKSQFLKCSGCNMKVKISSMNSTLTSTFQMKTDDGILKLTAFNSPLVNFLITMQKEHLKNDADQLENFLLMQQKMKVEYAKADCVVSKMNAI